MGRAAREARRAHDRRAIDTHPEYVGMVPIEVAQSGGWMKESPQRWATVGMWLLEQGAERDLTDVEMAHFGAIIEAARDWWQRLAETFAEEHAEREVNR
jgi:hypothetical protein